MVDRTDCSSPPGAKEKRERFWLCRCSKARCASASSVFAATSNPLNGKSIRTFRANTMFDCETRPQEMSCGEDSRTPLQRTADCQEGEKKIKNKILRDSPGRSALSGFRSNQNFRETHDGMPRLAPHDIHRNLLEKLNIGRPVFGGYLACIR